MAPALGCAKIVNTLINHMQQIFRLLSRREKLFVAARQDNGA